MSDAVPNLRPNPILSWVGLLLAVISPFGSLIWFAAKYPDRTEHNDVVLRLNRLEIESVRSSANTESSRAATERLEVEVRRLNDQLTAIYQQGRHR